ncbi:hypothetical protein NKR23_g4121 [Pleurostoma richardsiae]|uniref:Uncharacterized protein n=1 Tax=Pleurostoma richardsiae TaxID=41990 RepID=A0AA38VST5_9PEZI|nr:hypothetical protein NKR23_g4121 [Pleurostoma richardsiae]
MASPTDEDSAMTRETHQPSSSSSASQPVPTESSRRSTRRRRTRPEQGSLHGLLREYCGTSLYVLPICWTDLHAQLLDAQFVQLPPVLAPVPPIDSSNPQPQPSLTARALSSELTHLLSGSATPQYFKPMAIKSILSTLFPLGLSKAKSSAELDIHFGNRVFRKAIRVPVVWKHHESASSSFDSAITRPASSFGKRPGSSSNFGRSIDNSQVSQTGPILAYINRTHLAAIRANLFRVVPGPQSGDISNGPVSSLQRLRSKLLIPANVDHDAHFVGVLLAMAQAHFYEPGTPPPSRMSSQPLKSPAGSQDPAYSDFRDVKVQIITHTDETSEFIIYTAVVTAAFLQRWSSPAKLPKLEDGHDCGMKIEYARVPIWPILGLKERLGKALGHEIAGDGLNDAESIETWETQEDREARLGSRKRRRGDREALTEVVNQSFESQPDESHETGTGSNVSSALGVPSATPLSPRAKRRRTRARSELEVC